MTTTTTPKRGTTALIAHRPLCDVCAVDGDHRPAMFDAKTILGPWAYLCSDHFDAHGMALGTGFGQRLIVAGEAS